MDTTIMQTNIAIMQTNIDAVAILFGVLENEPI